MREQEFGREGVADMLASALVGQGVEIAPQEEITEFVRQSELVARRLVASQTLPDGGVGFTMIDSREAAIIRDRFWRERTWLAFSCVELTLRLSCS